MAVRKRLLDAYRLIIDLAKANKHGRLEHDDVLAVIASQETVDAVEVVHGRWEETLVPDGYVQKASRMRKKCSICGWTNACRYKYCPTCGAKMDGERKDNETL